MYRWPELQFGSWNPSGAAHRALETASVVQLIEALNKDATRERALHLLSKNRAIREELAPLLWHSVGTISILLQEVISVYHSLYSPTLTERVSNRVCDALVLFQCVAANPSTKMPFIEAKLPLYLYPFLNNTNKERPHEFLRLASLSVIGALAKVDDPTVINFLLESEVFPCCLRCMEVGDVLSKTVSALTSNISYFKLVASTVFHHSVAYLWFLDCYHMLCSETNTTDIFEKIFLGKVITMKKFNGKAKVPTIYDDTGKAEKLISCIMPMENLSSSTFLFLQLELCFKV